MGDRQQPKSIARQAARPAPAGSKTATWDDEDDRETWYHGTPDERHWDKGGPYGFHVGSYEAARQALEATIGAPAEGDWDGTREYGKTPIVSNKKNMGYHTGLSYRDKGQPRHENARYGDGTPIPPDARPSIFPVRITGRMANSPEQPADDEYANNQVRRRNAPYGYYYSNVGEDSGSVSAALPSAKHVERLRQGPKTAAWHHDTSGSEHSGVYLRFGAWPHDERSFSPAGGYKEEGVSVYDLDRDGDPAIGHGLDRGHVHESGYCDVDEDGHCQNEDPWGEPDNDPQEEMRGRKAKAERARYYGEDRDDTVGHLVRGRVSGVGYDGEPLLKNVKRVGDWIDHRHHFLDQAGPHRLAREPGDEGYEEPEETPSYGYRSRHEAALAPRTSAREEQLAAMDPRTRATALAQEQMRNYHPKTMMRLDTRNGQSSKVLTSWLAAHGHPGAEDAYVAEHRAPGEMQSNTGRGPDGEPAVVLHPDRWDYGTLAHEAAHLITDHQTGRRFGEPHGPEGAHGPEWAKNYANLLNQVSKGAGGHFMSLYKQHSPKPEPVPHREHGEPQRQSVPTAGLVYLSVPHGTLHALPAGMQPRQSTAEGEHHVTVAHLPRNMSDEEHAEVLRHAARAAAASPPLEGHLGGMETFPRGAGAETRRVAFVPARVPGIDRLHEDLAKVNVSPHHTFEPHVTVAYLRKGEDNPGQHPQVPVRFTHLHVERGGQVTSFPLTGGMQREAAAAEPWRQHAASEPNRAAFTRAMDVTRRAHPEVDAPVADRDATPVLHKMLGHGRFLYDEGQIEQHRAPAGPHTAATLAGHAAHLMTEHRIARGDDRGTHGTADERAHGDMFAVHHALALQAVSREAAGTFRSAYREAAPEVAGYRHSLGLNRDYSGSGLSPHMPPDLSHLPPMPESQQRANDADDRSYKRMMLDVAKNPEPGTRIWRGERRSAAEDPASPGSVGIHWTVHPANVITHPYREDAGSRSVIWQARLEHPGEQAIPRSHPMWYGQHMSMDSEAEVRLRPRSTVHVEGAWVSDPGDVKGGIYPMRPEHNGPGWTWHPVDKHVEVRHAGHEIDYSDVGIHREAAAGRRYYHGTGHSYETGQIIPRERTYYTPNRPLAASYSPNRRTGHVYEVEPVEGHTPDPEYPEGVSYYASKVRVTGEANNSMHPQEGESHWWAGGTHHEAAAEEEPKTYLHVSYERFPRGHMLTPQGKGWSNFDSSSGEHVYMTDSDDNAERYRYHLWEQGYPEQHKYEVRPTGPVEPDPDDPEAVRTRHPVEVTWAHDVDDEGNEESESDWFNHRTAAGYDLKPRSGMIYLDLPPGAVRPVPGGVDDHHITLVYLGSGVTDDAFEEACRRVKAAAARHAPMDGVLRGIDVFPPPKGSDGKVVAFVPAFVGGIGALRRELEDLSASEHTDYRPHCTLAYMEEGDSLPAPHPAVPLRFTHVHVKRGDDVVSYPLTGSIRKGASYEDVTDEARERRRQRVDRHLEGRGEWMPIPSKWAPGFSNSRLHGIMDAHSGGHFPVDHWEHLPDQAVSLRQKIHEHQGYVYPEAVRHKLRSDFENDFDDWGEEGLEGGGSDPKFVKHQGDTYLVDGHHRFARARLMGHSSMWGKVFDTSNPEHYPQNCYECNEGRDEDGSEW